MKHCPQCKHVTTDDLAFCRFDGVRLVSKSDSFADGETVVLLTDTTGGSTSVNAFSKGLAASTTVLDSPKAASPASGLIVEHDKRIGVRVIAVVILILVLAVYHSVTRKNHEVINSLAVLPFSNVGADQQLDYLCDGMTETLINNLSQLPNLNVKSRSSVFRYKGRDVTPRIVGGELNVQAILNGRIVQLDDTLTLSLELADANTENVIWSEQYSRKENELVSLQGEVARDIAGRLRVKLAGSDQQRLSNEYTTDGEAYQLYLKGRFYWNRRTAKDFDRAIDCFRQAISLDPDYALAYAGLADSYALLPFYRDAPLRQAMHRAREAATRALSLDGNLVEAHSSLGLVNTVESNFTEADREFKLAIELDPNYATAHTFYGLMLTCLGRHQEALAELQRALEIDPVSLIANVRYGEGLFYARRYDEAVAQLKKAIDLDAGFERAHSTLFAVYQAKGNYAKGVEEFAKHQELMGERQTATLARDSFASGGWQGFLRAMTGEQRPASLSRYDEVVFLAALGEKDKAFAELDKSYEVFLLRVDPLLDPLRDDPRFAEIMRRAGGSTLATRR